jgi:bifunctional non-homologous end joining protein LigD
MDSLRAYHAKRDFDQSPEPAGKPATGAGHSFVVQKHDATLLHWDFRLEWRGVLLSWAVTRGPSDAPSAKRLAVRTEDHPLDYAAFEGVIPKGQYGGGTVMVWDSGTYRALTDMDQGLIQGSLKLRLSGQRMNGDWALVRMKPRADERRENWLLIKERDVFKTDDPDRLVRVHLTSVQTGRDMAAIAAGAASVSDRPTPALPRFQPVQLAMSQPDPPTGQGWLHEVKYDGYRCLAAIAPPQVRFFTRSGLDWTDTFAALADDARRLPCASALIDGEVTTPEGGAQAFGLLQQRLELGGPIVLMAFDLLELDGEDLRPLPLRVRKDRLRALVAEGTGAIRFADHIDGHGADVWAHAQAKGWEGIVSKKADSPYRGGRQKNWIKVKCAQRQEFVIGGWKASGVKGRPFASLLVGTIEGGALRFRGAVGSGFNDATLDKTMERLAGLKQPASPFRDAPRMSGAHWVRPDLACEVKFAGFTTGGQVRHGVFLGLREDKLTRDIIEEPHKPAQSKDTARIRGVIITHPDRRVFEKPPVTKLALAHYVDAFADRMLPFVKDRPLSLLRCPDSIDKACFFQKHRTPGMPDAIEAAGQDATGAEDYIAIGNAAGLVAAVQMGTVEFHIWGSTSSDIERPDRLVFDLDPDEGLDFAEVRAAAGEVRDFLGQLDLVCVPMLSGGKGIHVVVALRKSADWPTVKLFARTVAVALSQRNPERFTSTMSKAERKGRIFIDWLRNERGSTAIAPYSPRARQGAGVAAPLNWAELATATSAQQYDLSNALHLLDRPCPLLTSRKLAKPLGPRVLRALERAL